MDMTASRLSYREHQWDVIRPERDDRPNLRDQASLWFCGSDSQRAVEWSGSPYRFFFDLELLAAGLDVDLGGSVHKLAEPWHGHPIGAVVMTVFERDDSEIGVRTTYLLTDRAHLQPTAGGS